MGGRQEKGKLERISRRNGEGWEGRGDRVDNWEEGKKGRREEEEGIEVNER